MREKERDKVKISAVLTGSNFKRVQEAQKMFGVTFSSAINILLATSEP